MLIKSKSMKKIRKLPNWLEIDAMSLTEAAALACYRWIGKGNERAADHAAVEAMRAEFSLKAIQGTVVIGEGERDEAPMLYIGETLGKGGIDLDIAVDPLEGTTLCAHMAANSLSVLALAPRGSLLNAPDVYMDKVAVGVDVKNGEIDLDNSITENLTNLAKIKGCEVKDLTVAVLNRPRHQKLIAEIREAGAKIQLITDGDVAAVIATVTENTSVDMYAGIGGAPEGVLAAAALSCMGGFMQGRLHFTDESQKSKAQNFEIKNLVHKFNLPDMVKDDVIFSATGVTSGWLLKGVNVNRNGKAQTHSIVMHRANKSIQYIEKFLKIIDN